MILIVMGIIAFIIRSPCGGGSCTAITITVAVLLLLQLDRRRRFDERGQTVLLLILLQ